MVKKPSYENSEKRIQELEQVTADLKLQNKRLQNEIFLIDSLFNEVTVPVFYKDKEGRYLGFNKAFETFSGETRDRLVGKSVFDISPPELAEVYHKKDCDLLENGNFQQYESQVKNSLGEIRNVIFKKTVFNDRQGNIAGLIGTVLDITETKIAEQKLKEREEKYKGIFNDSIAAIYVFDTDKNFLDSNQAGLDLLGYSRNELLSMSIPDVDADPVAVLPAHNQLLGGDRIINYEHRLTHKDGKIITVLNNSRPLLDRKNTVIGMLSTLIDITEKRKTQEALQKAHNDLEQRVQERTAELESINKELKLEIAERKQAVEALRDSEERFRSLVETTSDWIWETNAEGVYTYASPRVETILGYKSDEVVGKTPFDLMPPEEAERVAIIFRDLVRKGKAITAMENVNLRKDGQRIVLETSGVPIFDETGKITGYRGVDRNITERKQAEEELRESEFFLRETQRVARLGGWKLNLETDFLAWTEGVYDIIEAPLDYKPGLKEGLKYYVPEYLPALQSRIQRCFTHGDHFAEECELITDSGKRLWTEVRGVARVVEGKTVYVYGTFQDISERKQVEKEKRETLEFAAEQRKHALIGKVAGKMAHDFNNVLMGIMGNAQLAIINCHDEKTKEKLERINEFSERGRDITNTLISFSKDQEPKQTNFKVVDKIELVLKMLEKDLTGIEVSRNYKSGIPELLADPGMIQDVLVNLILNSIHAMSKVENPVLHLKAYCQNDKVYFEIEDNGCGIPKEHQDSIFTPSFTLKGSNDRTRSYKSGITGTGYGMSNVKKYIVEKHKGDISLESEVGKGTRIMVGLKVITNHLVPHEKKEVAKRQIFDKRRILLVEDEATIADVQYQILTSEPFGHIVSIAANGQTAIDIFDRNNFDLVSLDYMLPGKSNGLDVYNHIRQKDKDVPVMFISGNIAFLESMTQLTENDPNLDHLSKPVDNLEYVNKINELIGKSTK